MIRLKTVLAAGIFLFGIWFIAQTAFAATTLTVNVTADLSDADLSDGVCDTDLAIPGEQCSLRAAIEQLNELGPDLTPHQIHFDIPGVGPHAIAPLSALPWIQVPVEVDGATQPGATCPTASAPATLQVVLDGSSQPSGTGLWLHTGSAGSTLRGLVVGNFAKGIEVRSSGNRIECNHIGLGADGVTDMGNADSGLTLGTGANDNVIGGDASPAQRNVISGNRGEGIFFSGNENTLVANNYIGTTADGLSPLGNATGVFVIGADNFVGGGSPLAGNVISGNGIGVYLLDSQNSQVWGNFIGVGADGVTPVPNSDHGVRLGHTTTGNLIGGLGNAEPNVIAHNNNVGIYVQTGAGEQNALRGNRLFANRTLGIELGDNGVDINDPGDADTGPNGHQNYPVLASATDLAVSGTLDSAADQTYDLDFYRNTTCDPSGHGEGELYLGTTTVVTDSSGHTSFTYSFSGSVSPGDYLTATAIDPQGNTSEFSACVVAEAATTPTPTPTPEDPAQVYLPLMSNGLLFASTSGSLEDGDIFSGLDNVTLGTVSGTLTDTLNVSIAYTSAPTPTMIANSPVHGHYYRVAAARDVSVSHPAYFVLGLPVPAGVPTDILGVAIFDETAAAWAPILGFYDDVSELMLVPLSRLTTAGKTVVLIENSGFNSQRPATSAALSQAAAIQSDLFDFEVTCMSEYNSGFAAPNCNGHGPILTDFLALVYTEFNDMGYEEPWLEYVLRDISILDRNTEEPSVVVQAAQTVYQVYGLESSIFLDECTLDPDGGVIVHGPGFFFQERKALFCFDFALESPLTNAQKRAIRHLYFHALQFGYDHVESKVYSNDYDVWVLESTASAAEISIPAGMESSNNHPRRAVDVPLRIYERSSEFSAQDFWVYHGRAAGVGLPLLRDYLQLPAAAKLSGVTEFFGGDQGFKDTYWRWVKNQVMLEDNILLNDDDTGLQCAFQPYSLEEGVTGLGDNQDFWLEIGLTPLTSHVIRLAEPFASLGLTSHFEIVNPDFPYPLRDPDLQYKVYVDAPGCAGAVENDVVLEQNFSETTNFYVVIANVHPTEAREYRLQGD